MFSRFGILYQEKSGNPGLQTAQSGELFKTEKPRAWILLDNLYLMLTSQNTTEATYLHNKGGSIYKNEADPKY
jgi:hypothetical protein